MIIYFFRHTFSLECENIAWITKNEVNAIMTSHLISEAHGNQQRNKLKCQAVGVIIPQLNTEVWARNVTVIDSPTTPVLLPNAGGGAFRRIKESLESLHMFILTKMKDARQLPDTLFPQLKREKGY